MSTHRLFIPIVQLAMQRTPEVNSILKNFEEAIRNRADDTATILRNAVCTEVERIADMQLTDEDQHRLQGMMLDRVHEALRALSG